MNVEEGSKQFEEFAAAAAEVDQVLPKLVWETADAQAQLTHFVGRGEGWTVQLVCLGRSFDTREQVESMGTASKGSLILKLTDDQCRAAEKCARGGP